MVRGYFSLDERRPVAIVFLHTADALPMKRQRTIYYNDARHYYLFVFEPPMAMVDA